MTVSPTPPQDDVKSMVYSGEDAFVPSESGAGVGAQPLERAFSRRETSLSMAARMRSRRSSPSASTASIRALAPRGRVRLTFSCHSFARPMRLGVACTCKSVKAVSFRVRDSLTYHVRGICSIAYTIGTDEMKIWSRRFTPSLGNHWKVERECAPQAVQQWLAIFRADEPNTCFIGQSRRPAK